jgi:hypothetical protein
MDPIFRQTDRCRRAKGLTLCKHAQRTRIQRALNIELHHWKLESKSQKARHIGKGDHRFCRVPQGINIVCWPSTACT